jgi:hypothetical protein
MVKSVPGPFLIAPDEIHDRPLVQRNTLFYNRGDGTWSDIAEYAGVAASDWTWSAVFLDVDLDGYEDILVTNGHLHDVNDADTNAALPGLDGVARGADVGAPGDAGWASAHPVLRVVDRADAGRDLVLGAAALNGPAAAAARSPRGTSGPDPGQWPLPMGAWHSPFGR